MESKGYIIKDTREQKPIMFTKSVNTCTKKIVCGDYGFEIGGKLHEVVFERKSPMDLFGTLGQGHSRFKKEIERAKENNLRLVVLVEAPYSSIKRKDFQDSWRTKMKGYIVVKIMHAIYAKYNVPFIFFQDRTEMRDYIQDYYKRLIQ